MPYLIINEHGDRLRTLAGRWRPWRDVFVRGDAEHLESFPTLREAQKFCRLLASEGEVGKPYKVNQE